MAPKYLFISALLLSASWAQAKCELPKGEKVIIGCSTGCSFVYRMRLHLASLFTGIPVEITNMSKTGEGVEALEKVDAVLVPGGEDIDPRFYLDRISSELRTYTEEKLNLVEFTPEGSFRDPYEYTLIKSYSQTAKFEKMPMLGICRGMQMMAVTEGIPLYLDIKQELGIENRRNLFDTIEIEEKATLLSSLYEVKQISGFKYHHQGIRMPYYNMNKDSYPQLKVTATSHERKIAEAIEYTHRPAIGVQFHPEKSFPEASSPLFNWLFNKACEYKNSH